MLIDMKNFASRLKKFLLPVAVIVLAAAVAVVAPVSGIAAAFRLIHINANEITVLSSAKISNLPSKTATVGATIPTLPTVTVSTSTSNVTDAVRLFHAGRKIDTSNIKTYEEVGTYEYRFYTAQNDADYAYFDTYTVTVTKSDYSITLPTNPENIIPTIVPKNIGTLTLSMPTEIYKDDKTAEDDNLLLDVNFWTKYSITVSAKIGGNALTATVSNDCKTVSILSIPAAGTLKIAYQLKDKTSSAILAIKQLTDIEIKDIGTVQFSSNPTAPSVSGLLYKKDITLTAPMMPTATYKINGVDTSLTAEGFTKISAVKYSENEPDNWDNVAEKTGTNMNDVITIDSANPLKVSAEKIGWYKFQFKTTTLFGYQNSDDSSINGEYWSDAVNVNQDKTAPEIKWTKEYTVFTSDKDAREYFDKVGSGKADEIEDFSKYLPNQTADSKNKVKNSIKFPALIAKDNATEWGSGADADTSNKLTYSITIRKTNDINGNVNQKSYYISSGYKPDKYFTINFNSAVGSNAHNDNAATIVDGDGKYQVTFYAYDKQPAGSTSAGPSAYQTFYFTVDSNYDTSSNPVVSQFYIPDMYLWEGNTFEFAVPTATDDTTGSADIYMKYYLTCGADIIEITEEQKDGKIKIDTTDTTKYTSITWTNVVGVYAVAYGFNALQSFAAGISQKPTDTVLPTNIKLANFKIHNSTASSTGTVGSKISTSDTTYTQNKKVEIAKIAVDWDSSNGGTYTIDSRVSVSVYQINKNNKHEYTPIYNADDEIVSAVLFNDEKTDEIEKWYFTPTNSGDYYVLVTMKENAANEQHSFITKIVVTSDDSWVISPINTAAVTPMATDATYGSLTVGQTGVLPNYKLTKPDGSKVIAQNRGLYDESNLGTRTGYYTVTVKGVNDPNCVTGNKFTPNKAGTYKFEYNFYYDISTPNKIQTIVHIVTVTAPSDSIKIKMANDYGTSAISPASPDSTTAIILYEFLESNDGGTSNFTADTKKLKDGLNQIASTNPTEYQYPLIAIPMPNVVGGGYTTDDVVITVQKSGSSDYLVDTSLTKIKDPADNTKYIESKYGKTAGGLFVFRPTGKFTGSGDNFMSTAVDKDEANGIYVVTYSLPNVTVTYNITVGEVEVGALKFNSDGKLLSYKDKDKNDAYIAHNDTLSVPAGNSVTINMDKVTYDGKNANFMKLIETYSTVELDGKNATAEERARQYIFDKTTVNVYKDDLLFIYNGSSEGTNGFHKDENNRTYSFVPTDAGVYRVEISLYNEYTQTSTSINDAKITFTYELGANEEVMDLSTVWGIILIVLSVGLLGGVVFYFIKTGRETKFGGPVRPEKPKTKEKGQETSVSETGGDKSAKPLEEQKDA